MKDFSGTPLIDSDYPVMVALEQELGKPIPLIQFEASERTGISIPFGYTVENGRITGIFIPAGNLKTLPKDIGNLTSVRNLYVIKNILETLPDSIGGMSSLQRLFITDNQLTSIPESVAQLQSLEYLIIARNQLTTLPQNIDQLTKLRWLLVNHNNLSAIPSSIGNMSSLEILRLSENKLTSLPESIGNLSNLKELEISNNKLTSLPASIVKLASLTSLWILGTNPLTRLDLSKSQLEWLDNLLFQHRFHENIPSGKRSAMIIPVDGGTPIQISVTNRGQAEFAFRCRQCSAVLPVNATFCNKCGAKIER